MNGESEYILGIETAARTCSAAIVSQNKSIPHLSPPPITPPPLTKGRRGDLDFPLTKEAGEIKKGSGKNSYNVKVLAECNSDTENNHEPHLMPLIEKALSDCNLKLADVSGIAVSIGPGSFTGLRIGIASAKGLALASGKPAVGIPTLDGLGCNVILSSNVNIHSTIICPMLDAHRGEVYSALYRYPGESVLQKITPYMVMPLEKLLEKITERTTFVGDINRKIIEKKLGDKAIFAPPQLNQPKAASIAYLGMLRGELTQAKACGYQVAATFRLRGKGNSQMHELEPIYLSKARVEEELPITLDEMKEEDIAHIMKIEKESFPTPWSETMFKNMDRDISIVARFGGKITGYAVGIMAYDELHLGNIAVHKDFRGRGIAKKLLQRIIDIARSKEIGLVTLEVRAGNIHAQRLYRKFGFKTTGRRKEYYQDTKEDAVIMTLKG